MAWLSVGTSHEDLCQKLSQHGILSDLEIKNAFRSTDRGDFVLPEDRYVIQYVFFFLINIYPQNF